MERFHTGLILLGIIDISFCRLDRRIYSEKNIETIHKIEDKNEI